MSERIPRRSAAPDTGVSTGLLVASALAPGTFARSLSVRTAVDQGIVTGLAAGLHYLLTVGTQDTLQAVAAEVTGAGGRQRRLTLVADLAAIPVGLAVQRAVPPRPGEPMARGLLRQSGWRLVVTGVGGTLLLATQAGVRALDARLGARPDRDAPGGAAGRPRRRVPAGPAPGRAGSRGAAVAPDEPRVDRCGRSPWPRASSAAWPALGVRRARRGRPGRAAAGVGAARRPGAVEAGRARRLLALLGAGVSAVCGRAIQQDRGGDVGECCR